MSTKLYDVTWLYTYSCHNDEAQGLLPLNKKKYVRLADSDFKLSGRWTYEVVSSFFLTFMNPASYI
jgi:hypothetical protein